MSEELHERITDLEHTEISLVEKLEEAEQQRDELLAALKWCSEMLLTFGVVYAPAEEAIAKAENRS